MTTTDNDTTWDTEETSRIIANDEPLYNRAMQLSRNAYSIGRLAYLMESEFEDIIGEYPYSDIELAKVVWEEIASEYMED